MFDPPLEQLMWAQQWHYIARAVTLGYSVLRSDTDVYLAEDPYPILRGPLMQPFNLIVQQDFGGPLGRRPACARIVRQQHGDTPIASWPAGELPPPIASCGAHHGTSLLNIGLVYIRASAAGGGGGGALAVINGTWVRFLEQLGSPRTTPGSAQPQHVESLIDQPLMRQVVSDLSIAEPGSKGRGAWSIVPGSGAPVYRAGDECVLGEAGACARVAEARSRTAFLAQLVKPRRTGGRAERIALAPDWLFGRGCLVAVRAPLELLQHATPSTPVQDTQCVQPPTRPRRAPPAPGHAGGILVATHFVYSMAHKRQRSFQAFGWDLHDARNRTSYEPGVKCWKRSNRAMLFGHTFFSQAEDKAVLCSMPPNGKGEVPECSCCVGLKSLEGASTPPASHALGMETTGGHVTRWNQQRARLLQQGCGDYQAFWD